MQRVGRGPCPARPLSPGVPSIGGGGQPSSWGAPNPLTLLFPHRWPVPAVALGLLLVSPGRDGCWVSWDWHAQALGYGGPDAPGRVSTPFLPPPLSSSAAANPILEPAGWERVSVILSLSFMAAGPGLPVTPVSPPVPSPPMEPGQPPGRSQPPLAQPSPAPAPRLDAVPSRLPVPRPGDVAVAAPCPAPVPSVLRGRGRVGVLPPGSCLCFPAVCACVSPPLLIPTPHPGALQWASSAGDPRAPPEPAQPSGISCSCQHANPLGAGVPARGRPVRWPWHVPIPVWGNGAAPPSSAH